MDCRQHVQKMHKLSHSLLAEETESTVMEVKTPIRKKTFSHVTRRSCRLSVKFPSNPSTEHAVLGGGP